MRNPKKNLDQLSSLMLVAQGCRFSTLRIKLRIPCLNPVNSPSHYYLVVVVSLLFTKKPQLLKIIYLFRYLSTYLVIFAHFKLKFAA